MERRKSREEKSRKKIKNTLMAALLVLSSGVFLFSAYKIGSHYLRAAREKNVQDGVVAMLRTEPDRPIDPQSPPDTESSPGVSAPSAPLYKYEDILAQNSECIGWLKIDDTQVNGPVMYSPDEPRKYLNADFFGKYAYSGSFFLDENCSPDNFDNLLIHGHRMNNGTMFGELHKYMEPEFWEAHKTFSFDSMYETRTFEVVAVCKMRVLYVDEEGYDYQLFSKAADEAEFVEYMDYVRETRLFDTGVTAEYGDKLVSLSTCLRNDYTGRLVVVAKLVPES